MSPRADTTVGQMTARARTTTRRGTPWQDRSPFDLWPAATAAMAASGQGPPPAHPRHAIATRVHQTGGAPTRSAPTRRATHPDPRRTSPATGSPAASRPYVLALTRCGRCVLTRRAAGACPAPAGEPATQPTNQHSTPAVLDNAVPHQVDGLADVAPHGGSADGEAAGQPVAGVAVAKVREDEQGLLAGLQASPAAADGPPAGSQHLGSGGSGCGSTAGSWHDRSAQCSLGDDGCLGRLGHLRGASSFLDDRHAAIYTRASLVRVTMKSAHCVLAQSPAAHARPSRTLNGGTAAHTAPNIVRLVARTWPRK